MLALYFLGCGSIWRRSGRFERRCAGAPAHRFRKNLMPSAAERSRGDQYWRTVDKGGGPLSLR